MRRSGCSGLVTGFSIICQCRLRHSAVIPGPPISVFTRDRHLDVPKSAIADLGAAAREPGIHNHGLGLWDSGLAPSARPGMTGESSAQSNWLCAVPRATRRLYCDTVRSPRLILPQPWQRISLALHTRAHILT